MKGFFGFPESLMSDLPDLGSERLESHGALHVFDLTNGLSVLVWDICQLNSQSCLLGSCGSFSLDFHISLAATEWQAAHQ